MLQRMLRQWKSQRKVPNFLPKVSWFPGSQWHWPGLVPSVRAQTTQLFFVIYRPAFAQPQDASRRLHRRTRSSFPSVGAGTAEFAWCLWQDLTVIYFWESNLFAAWLVPPFGNPTFLEIKPFFGNPTFLGIQSFCINYQIVLVAGLCYTGLPLDWLPEGSSRCSRNTWKVCHSSSGWMAAWSNAYDTNVYKIYS